MAVECHEPLATRRKQNSKNIELVGYHGTSRENAYQLFENKNKFLPSENGYDWLGWGVYFWLLTPERARLWAETKYKADNNPAIIKQPFAQKTLKFA